MMLKEIKKYYHYQNWYWKNKSELKKIQTYNVLSFEQTIFEITNHQKSISRFGDGEFWLCLPGGAIGFQQQDDSLTDKLNEVLNSNLPNLIVAIPETFQNTKKLNLNSKYWWENHLLKNYQYFEHLLAKNKIYGNSFISRFYLDYKRNRKITEQKIKLLKTIWDNQDVLIVEGKYSRLGVGNNLFSNAKSLQRIICPPQDAYSLYTEILTTTKENGKNKLILLALGATATAMSYDLAKEHYWAVDIGHIDIEYMWFLQNATVKTPLEGRVIGEVREQKSIEIPVLYLAEYQNSIIKIIE